MSEATWTREDRARIRDLMAEMSEAAKRPISLEGLLERWTDFVGAIERGYRDSLDDYTNELSVRDLLARVTAVLSKAGHAHLLRTLGPLDDRFHAVTRPILRPLLPPLAGETLGPWWSRVPKVLVDELRDDLHAKGVV